VRQRRRVNDPLRGVDKVGTAMEDTSQSSSIKGPQCDAHKPKPCAGKRLPHSLTNQPDPCTHNRQPHRAQPRISERGGVGGDVV
jgi:hypothetical protein